MGDEFEKQLDFIVMKWYTPPIRTNVRFFGYAMKINPLRMKSRSQHHQRINHHKALTTPKLPKATEKLRFTDSVA